MKKLLEDILNEIDRIQKEFTLHRRTKYFIQDCEICMKGDLQPFSSDIVLFTYLVDIMILDTRINDGYLSMYHYSGFITSSNEWINETTSVYKRALNILKKIKNFKRYNVHGLIEEIK